MTSTSTSASILTPIDSDLYRATDITILHVPMCFSLCSLLPIRCNRTGCCYFFFCAYEINYGTNRLPPTFFSPPGGRKILVDTPAEAKRDNLGVRDQTSSSRSHAKPAVAVRQFPFASREKNEPVTVVDLFPVALSDWTNIARLKLNILFCFKFEEET